MIWQMRFLCGTDMIVDAKWMWDGTLGNWAVLFKFKLFAHFPGPLRM